MNSAKNDPSSHLLSWSGRMGRMRYFVYTALLLVGFLPFLIYVFEFLYDMLIAFKLSNKIIHLYVILFIFLLISLIILITLTSQRLHDINLSGWLGLLVIIPVINLLLILVLFFIAGTKGENRFGLQPKPNSTIMRVLFWVCGALVLFSFVTPASYIWLG